MKMMVDANWSKARQELHPVVADALDRAHTLNRAGRLNADRLGDIAGWDRDLLRAMAAVSTSQLPGTFEEEQTLKAALSEAVVKAIERDPGPRPPVERRAAEHRGVRSRNARAQEEILRWLLEAEEDDANIVEFADENAYIQFRIDTDVIVMELSGGPEVGGQARLSPEQERTARRLGWKRPHRNADYPNYWRTWDRVLDRRGRLDLDTAQGVVDDIGATAEQVFGIEF